MLPRSLTELVKLHEGFSGVPYRDTSGHLTIGYGRNLDVNPLTPAEAQWLLVFDLGRSTKWAERYGWFAGLSDVRQAVVVDMMYNLGPRGFRAFRKMRAALAARDYDKAADEMLDSRWRVQVGERATRLAEMMRSNKWPMR